MPVYWLLVDLQERTSTMAGNWTAILVRARGAGFTTALAALSLEVYYRYAPIKAGQ